MCMLYCLYDAIKHLLLTVVLGEAAGLLRVFSQQRLIMRKRLHKSYEAGQRHGLPHPNTVLPEVHKNTQTRSQYVHVCTYFTCMYSHCNGPNQNIEFAEWMNHCFNSALSGLWILD